MAEFHYQEMFELGEDETEYRKLGDEGVSTVEIDGRSILKIEPQALSRLAAEAIRDVCHKELPGFGEKMRAASLDVGVPTAILSRQTAAILEKIDSILAESGTDKSRLLTCNIWLRDIEADFAAMNEVWCEWVDPDNKPARATVQAEMARPAILVEIQVTAAV